MPGVADAPGAGATFALGLLAWAVLVLGGLGTAALLLAGCDRLYDGAGGDPAVLVAGVQTAFATAISSAVLFGLRDVLVLLRRIDAAGVPASKSGTRS